MMRAYAHIFGATSAAARGADERKHVMARNILITGATGKTGSHAASTLLGQGHRVRALVHRADERAARLAAAGAEVVTGDLLDLDAVSRAAKGVDAAYFTYPIAPGLLDGSRTMV